MCHFVRYIIITCKRYNAEFENRLLSIVFLSSHLDNSQIYVRISNVWPIFKFTESRMLSQEKFFFLNPRICPVIKHTLTIYIDIDTCVCVCVCVCVCIQVLWMKLYVSRQNLTMNETSLKLSTWYSIHLFMRIGRSTSKIVIWYRDLF